MYIANGIINKKYYYMKLPLKNNFFWFKVIYLI